MPLIDELLPTYDVSEQHSIAIRATPVSTYSAPSGIVPGLVIEGEYHPPHTTRPAMKRFPVPGALPVLAAALLLHAPASSHAQARDVASHPRVRQAIALMDVWLDAQRDFMQLPGLSVGVVHDQRLLWSSGYGFADLQRRTPATASTLYSICSISKLFTSIGVMQLRDEGRLRLDDPVGRHLDWFRIARADTLAPEVTLAGVLTHSAGLPRESAHPYWTGPGFSFPAREEIIERISSQEMLYPAEQYYQYSNLGMTLAGEVIAAISGESYESYIRRRILQPMGLTSTFVDMPAEYRGGRLATGYSTITREGRRDPVGFFATRGIAPAAGYASTVEDLARFASWQFRVLHRGGGEDILRRNTLREMQRVHWVDPDFETMRGLGFWVTRKGNRALVGHGGSCPGFRSQLIIEPEERIGTVALVNAQGVNARMLAERMYDIIAPALRAALRDSAPRPPDSTLARYAGLYDLGFSGETAIVEWEDGLAALSLPTLDPLEGLEKLRKVGEHTFRRVRHNDALGEPVVFVMGSDGRPAHIIWHQNEYRRIR
jgi:CubicO group peptidase (beta-lactamase class C family)